MTGPPAETREQMMARRAELERLALEYALGPKPSGDGAWDAFDAECAQIEREIADIDAALRVAS